MSDLNICPVCGQAGRVSKVSAVYIAGIQAQKGSSGEPLVPVGKISGIPAAALPALSRRLAPPAARKEAPLRLIHPDMVILIFSLIAPIFLLGIYNRQRMFFYPVLFGLIVTYGLYFWQHSAILRRFERQLEIERANKERIHRGIQRWMNLYYCADDDVVFEPGGAPPLPADQMQGYLLQD